MIANEHPPRNLGLDLVRVTEAAALSAGRWMGLGQRNEANQIAAEAMCKALNTLDMDGFIVVGEEERLGIHSPLDSGQRVGTGHGPAGSTGDSYGEVSASRWKHQKSGLAPSRPAFFMSRDGRYAARG